MSTSKCKYWNLHYKASLICYTPASCIDSFWCNHFFPLATLSFWVSAASYNGGWKRSQVSSRFCTHFICAVTAVTTRRCDQNGLKAKCVSNVACMQRDAPPRPPPPRPFAECTNRLYVGWGFRIPSLHSAPFSASLSFSKEPSAAEANGSNQKAPPRISAQVSQVLLYIYQQ